MKTLIATPSKEVDRRDTPIGLAQLQTNLQQTSFEPHNLVLPIHIVAKHIN